MNKNPLHSRVMCTIDSLLDLRLGALVVSQTPEFMESIRGPRYFNRSSDDFSQISTDFDKDAYKKAIEEYSSEIIKNTRFTNVVFMLACDAKYIENDLKENDQFEKFFFEINTYPYVFEDKAAAMLIQSVSEYLPKEAEVSIVRYSLEEMTPDMLKDNYDVLFIYNLSRWVNAQYKALMVKPIPEIRIHSPTLEVQRPEKDSEYEKVLKGMNHFQMYETFMSEYFNLVFLGTVTFSIINHSFITSGHK